MACMVGNMTISCMPLSLLIFLPLAVGLCLVPVWNRCKAAKWVALGGGVLELVIACLCWSASSAPVSDTVGITTMGKNLWLG